MEDVYMPHLMWSRSRLDYTMGEATQCIHERSWVDSVDPRWCSSIELLNILSRSDYFWNVEDSEGIAYVD